MTDPQTQVLAKGLKFTPTPNFDEREARVDINNFTRKLRLKEFFHDKHYDDDSIVKNKGTFTPEKGRDQHLDIYVEYLNKIPVGKQVRKNIRSNLNKAEREALRALRENNDIVIKEADKGSAIVIMNKSYYESKILGMLNDTNTYQMISANKDRYTLNQVKRLVDEAGDDFTKSEKDYLTKFESKTSQFYGLPKIHKSQLIIDKIKETQSECVELLDPTDLKFRPIVAGPVCPTHRLSSLIDILLKPFIKYVKSYIRDDIDFLNYLPQSISDDEIFTSFDVTSLYSNITQNLGLEAIDFWLSKFPDDINERFSKNFILKGIKIILENNTFEFGAHNYRQILGTAMGTKFAPNYATLVLGYLETKLYRIIQEKYDSNFSEFIQKTFKRYLDDCFLIWNKSKGEIDDFHKILNSLNTNINFTLETNALELPFLDILVKRLDGKIVTDIFYKPTDSKQYLEYFSCHPRHIKNNVPYNLARRICSIVVDIQLRNERLSELETSLMKRNYPREVIMTGINKAKSLDIKTLRTPKEASSQDTLVFIETYNPNVESCFSAVNTSLPILQTSNKMQGVLQNTRIIGAKRQAPNLKKMLTRAKLPQPDKSYKTSNCGDKRCKCCENIIETSSFYFQDLNLNFQIRCDMDCDTKNFIYVLFCGSCNSRYVGQSGDLCRSRVRVHRQHINTISPLSLHVSRHIAECAKNIYPQFKILPIYKMRTESLQERLEMEKRFITMLKPSLNR